VKLHGADKLSIADFLKGLTGKDRPSTVPDLEAAIGRLQAEKARAELEMTTIASRREQLLLEDRDSELDSDERSSERAFRTVEKCNIALADLRERLAAAKNSETEKRWRSFHEEYAAAALAYRDALRTGCERIAAMLAVNDRARDGGFEQRVMREFVAPPRMLSTEALAEFETALQRARMMAQPNPGPKPSPRPAAPPLSKPLQVINKTTRPTPAPKAERKRIVEAAGPGQVQARVQRNGYSKTDDGPQYGEGDVVALSPEKARIAIANGALDGALQ
jgi:hypothetical protein